MIEREITAVFRKAVKTHPVVAVFGPRQSGKTSLVYLERDGKYLILHRTKKAHDENGDKWIGVNIPFAQSTIHTYKPIT